METLIERLRKRATSNQGSVGILMALVMFFVCGMLIMTWNTYTLSREKMRLQNAADAAAIEHAVWQARGMNIVQNLNDEAYDILSLSVIGYMAGAFAGGAAVAVNAIPIVGQIVSGLLIATTVVVVDVTTWMLEVVLPFIKYVQDFWANGTPFFAYIAAQQAAAMNGATGIISHFIGQDPISFKLGSIVNISLDVHAVGLSLSPKETFTLPIERTTKKDGDLPWKPNAKLSKYFKTIRATPVVGQMVWLPTGTVEGFNPYVSKKGKVVVKKEKESEEEKDDDKSKDKSKDKSEDKSKDKSKDATKTKSEKKSGGFFSSIANFFKRGKKDKNATEQGQEIELSDMSEDKDKKKEEKKEEEKEETKEVKLLPSPTLWVCIKDYPSHDSIRSFDQWLFAKESELGSLHKPGQSPFPIMAYAVGQCVTGDIIEHTPDDEKKVNKVRIRGWGTGANAKLISLQEALIMTDHPTLKKFAGLIFYH